MTRPPGHADAGDKLGWTDNMGPGDRVGRTRWEVNVTAEAGTAETRAAPVLTSAGSALPARLCTGITHGVSEHVPGPTKHVWPSSAGAGSARGNIGGRTRKGGDGTTWTRGG
jgi:hypothetical protein